MRVHRSPWSEKSPRAKAEQRQREDAKRDRWSRRLYHTEAWKKLRGQVLREQPVCATFMCGEPSHHVDHIRPHRGDRAVFMDRSNLQGLCHSCHSRKTARYDHGGGE